MRECSDMNDSLKKEKNLLNKYNIEDRILEIMEDYYPGSHIDISFYDWDDPYGRFMQRSDNDYQVIIDGNKQLKVSVKTRDNNFDFQDILVEIFSSYKYNDLCGASLSDPGSELKSTADIFLYINDLKYIVINNHELRNLIIKLYSTNTRFLFSEKLSLIPYKKTYNHILKYPTEDGFKDIPVKFIKSKNERNKVEWDTISICLNIEILKSYKVGYKIVKY